MTKYVRVRIIGGLGNQLFQYATAYALAKKNRAQLQLDISDALEYKTHPYRLNMLFCEGEFIKKNNLIRKIIFKLGLGDFVSSYFVEKKLLFDQSLSDVDRNISLFGYFQDERYFLDVCDDLKRMFKPKCQLNNEQKAICRNISSKNTLAIHVRRGDYLSDEQSNKIHGSCSLNYYKSAVNKLINENVINSNTKLFVFSDDIEWCKLNLLFDLNTIFVNGDEGSPEIDLYIMSKAEHFVISNSTFSWWSAWLSDSPEKKVIAPKKWFNDGRLTSIQSSKWDLI